VLQCCSLLQCVAVYCSVLQCIAVCCSVLQCVESETGSSCETVFCVCEVSMCSFVEFLAVCRSVWQHFIRWSCLICPVKVSCACGVLQMRQLLHTMVLSHLQHTDHRMKQLSHLQHAKCTVLSHLHLACCK